MTSIPSLLERLVLASSSSPSWLSSPRPAPPVAAPSLPPAPSLVPLPPSASYAPVSGSNLALFPRLRILTPEEISSSPCPNAAWMSLSSVLTSPLNSRLNDQKSVASLIGISNFTWPKRCQRSPSGPQNLLRPSPVSQLTTHKSFSLLRLKTLT